MQVLKTKAMTGRPVAWTTAVSRWAMGGIFAASLSIAWGQGAPGGTTPRPDQLEPGVNTSAMPATSAPASPASPSSSSSAPAPAVPAARPTDRGATRRTSAPSEAAMGARAGGAAAPPKAGAAPGKAQDRLELDTTQITGNRELPKVLYIVPWKRSDLGDLLGKPVNSLLDEVLAPVDRDVFKRQNRYYEALKPDGPQQAAGAAAPGAGDKH